MSSLWNIYYPWSQSIYDCRTCGWLFSHVFFSFTFVTCILLICFFYLINSCLNLYIFLYSDRRVIVEFQHHQSFKLILVWIILAKPWVYISHFNLYTLWVQYVSLYKNTQTIQLCKHTNKRIHTYMLICFYTLDTYMLEYLFANTLSLTLIKPNLSYIAL